MFEATAFRRWSLHSCTIVTYIQRKNDDSGNRLLIKTSERPLNSPLPPFDVLEEMKNNPKICNYLDLPLQHISDNVLQSMKRGITSKETRDLVSKIKEMVPGITLRTTFIVGYPNETEKDFEELIEFIKEVKFDRIGAFVFSPEEDTSSFELGDPIPDEIILAIPVLSVAIHVTSKIKLQDSCQYQLYSRTKESDQIIEQTNPYGTIDSQRHGRFFLRYLANDLTCFTVNYLKNNRPVVQVDLKMEIIADLATGNVQFFGEIRQVSLFDFDFRQLFAGPGCGIATRQRRITTRLGNPSR